MYVCVYICKCMYIYIYISWHSIWHLFQQTFWFWHIFWHEFQAHSTASRVRNETLHWRNEEETSRTKRTTMKENQWDDVILIGPEKKTQAFFFDGTSNLSQFPNRPLTKWADNTFSGCCISPDNPPSNSREASLASICISHHGLETRPARMFTCSCKGWYIAVMTTMVL